AVVEAGEVLLHRVPAGPAAAGLAGATRACRIVGVVGVLSVALLVAVGAVRIPVAGVPVVPGLRPAGPLEVAVPAVRPAFAVGTAVGTVLGTAVGLTVGTALGTAVGLLGPPVVAPVAAVLRVPVAVALVVPVVRAVAALSPVGRSRTADRHVPQRRHGLRSLIGGALGGLRPPGSRRRAGRGRLRRPLVPPGGLLRGDRAQRPERILVRGGRLAALLGALGGLPDAVRQRRIVPAERPGVAATGAQAAVARRRLRRSRRPGGRSRRLLPQGRPGSGPGRTVLGDRAEHRGGLGRRRGPAALLGALGGLPDAVRQRRIVPAERPGVAPAGAPAPVARRRLRRGRPAGGRSRRLPLQRRPAARLCGRGREVLERLAGRLLRPAAADRAERIGVRAPAQRVRAERVLRAARPRAERVR